MKHKIIFVHGFGVKKDARGMFTDIKKSLSDDKKLKDVECILIDLNVVNGDNIYLNPLSVQAEILSKVYAEENTEDCKIDLICHSQGCVVASIANLPKIRKVFLLAPPTNNDIQRTINSFKERPGTKIDLKGESILTRKDGSTTIVPREYWSDRKELNYLNEYFTLSQSNKIIVILGKQDKTVSNEDIEKTLNNSIIEKIDGNHNFDGENNRQNLGEIIKKYL